MADIEFEGGVLGRELSKTESLAQELAAQRAFEGRLLDAIENLAGAFVLWDADDRLEVFNSRAKDLYGRHDDIMVEGRTFEEIIRKAVDTQAIKVAEGEREDWIQERVRHHKNVSEVMTRRYPDGRWVRIAEHKTKDGGIVSIGVDITELKKRELALEKAREDAVQANQAKTRFLAAASHDLRQPLHAMGLFLSSLSKRVHEPEQQGLVKNLQASLDGMNTLFSALLDISRLEAEVLKPQVTVFPVSKVLDNMANRFTVQAFDQDLQFTVMPCRLHVRSDPAMLERIVSNFVANAIRYTDKGRVLVGCRRHGKTLRIEVLDTGRGIPKNQLRDIFKEFHQVENPERDRTQGLGLGLAIAERMGQLLKHTISVTSHFGSGSCFAVDVPVADEQDVKTAPAPLPKAPGASLSGRLVVVVEDNKDILAGMKLMLDGLGCAVVAEESAPAAIAALAQQGRAPDIVIADYRLRNQAKGSDAILALRAAVGADTPGIIVTGDTAPQRLREARASGFHLLHKPVHPANLTAMIRHLLRDKP